MKKLLHRLMWGLIYLAGGLLVAELLVRLLGMKAETFPPPQMLENDGKSFGIECYPTNTDGEFPIRLQDQAAREAVAREGGLPLARLEELSLSLQYCVEFRYNQQTYRDKPFDAKAQALPPGARKILILGDSFTEGAGVKEEDTFPRRLEESLNREPGLWPAVVFNAGRRGRDLPQIREALLDLVPKLRPDVVIYGLVLNDFEQDPAYQEQQIFLNDLILDRQHMGEPTWKLPKVLQYSRLISLIAERMRSKTVTRDTIRWYQGMTGKDNKTGWEQTQNDLKEMNQWVKRHSGHFLVAILPLLYGLEGAESDYPFLAVHRDLMAACKKMQLDCLDLLPAFIGKISRSLWVHPVDMHPNKKAHEIIAEALFVELKKQDGENRKPSSLGK